MSRRKEETVLQKAITDALSALGLIALRINSGRVQVKRGWLHLAPQGTPDVLVQLRGGRTGWVEVKVSHPPGHNCDACVAQRAFRGRAEAAGALYVLARSVEEALKGLGVA